MSAFDLPVFGNGMSHWGNVGQIPWWGWGLLLSDCAWTMAVVWAWRRRRCRLAHLHQSKPPQWEPDCDTPIQIMAHDHEAAALDFSQNHIARIDHFLLPDCLHILREEATSLFGDKYPFALATIRIPSLGGLVFLILGEGKTEGGRRPTGVLPSPRIFLC
jgi:hypothetical protein